MRPVPLGALVLTGATGVVLATGAAASSGGSSAPRATSSGQGASLAPVAFRDPARRSSASDPSPAAPRAGSCPAVAGGAPMPTPGGVLGRTLDADPPSAEEADRLLLALDAASPRIVTGVAGRTVRGRPLRFAVAGAPASLTAGRLRAVSRAARAIRTGEGGPTAVRRLRRGPVITWVGGGVHANEPSGVTAALALLRRLGSGEDCDVRRVLHGALVVVVPDQNPDGRAAGTRTNAADVDLNRDWAAATQPETRARLALLRRFPPVLALDAHEQAGSGFFAPPYADPVVRGLPAATRRLADGPVSRAIGRALRGVGADATHRGYDLLYPGYADSASSLLFGAGGMTLEQGSDLPLSEKTRRHETAMLAALRVVATEPAAAQAAWADGFDRARRDGRAGRGTTGDVVHGWILRTDRHAADALALAGRLREDGVRVRELARRATLRVDPLGPAGTSRTVLPAGTLVVPADQPLARWADVLLGRDADEAGAASTGADTWSLPRAAGVDAAVLRAPVAPDALRAVRRVPTAPAGTTVAFSADSAAGARLALSALAAGTAVRRSADATRYRVVATPAVVRAARTSDVALRPTRAAPDDVVLRLPRPTTPADPTPLLTGPPATLQAVDRPAGWVAGALRAADVAPTLLAPASLDVGLPAGTTTLLLGPGALPDDGRDPGARATVGRFVRDGGTVLAVGTEGTRAARALGVSAVRSAGTTGRAAVAVRAVAGDDPVGRLLGRRTDVVVAGEPLLEAPAGAAVPLRAGRGASLAPSGARGAAAGLAGRPLVIDERVGAGRVLTVGFSPAFRRQSAAGEHVLLSLLLADR